MMSDDEITKKAFSEVTAHVVRSVSMRNANMKGSAIAEVVEK